MSDLKTAPDSQIRSRLRELAESEKRISLELIKHLVEFDRRDLFRADLVGNLWEYCTKILGFSEDQAGLRIRVARAVQQSPAIGLALENGELSVSAVRRLAPALRVAQGSVLAEKAKGLPLREVERIAADALARAPVPEERGKAAEPLLFSPAIGGLAETGATAERATAAARTADTAPSNGEVARLVRLRNPDLVQPVSGADWRLAFVVGAEFIRNLEFVRNLLARRHPETRLEDILGATLEMLLERIEPARRNARRRAKRALRRIPTVSRGVPRSMREAVLDRDRHQCTFKTPNGQCPIQRFLEIDYIVPVSLGGATTLENLRALCRGHHVIVTELAFGEAFIERAIARRRSATVTTALGLSQVN